jgi:PHD/YefM family antitoxin component YafN of YafNO toxin-antitoxin module
VKARLSEETLYWLSTPEVAKDVDAARAEVAACGGVSEDEVRVRFGAPRR